MRNKTTIIILLVVFSVICFYNLFFTVRQFNMSSRLNSLEKARNEVVQKGAALTPQDSVTLKEYNELMTDTAFQNDYKKSVDRSFALGLDLQGGMYATLEVGVEDVIRSLAPNAAKDSAFNKAIQMTLNQKQTSQESFVDLFLKNLKQINPNVNLGAVFSNQERNISVSSKEADVVKMLNEESTSAIDRTFNIVRTRIDQFGVVSPNLQKQERTGRIIVELPGVKEPERVRKILRSTAKLEFWTTYTIKEAINTMVAINDKVKVMKGIEVEDSTKTKTDSTKTAVVPGDKAKADSNKAEVVSSDSMAKDSNDAKLGDEEKAAKFKKENPFFAVLQLPDLRSIDPNSPLVGYATANDTAEVNMYLREEEVRSVVPDDMKFMWTLKPFGNSNAFGLLAMRSENGQAALGGDKIVTARYDVDQNTGRYIVDMAMNIEGAQEWAQITGDNIGKCVAVTLDGLVYSYPTVQGKISGGRSQISGNFTIDEAKDLANILKAGQLPVPAKIMGEDIVGPSLGESNINSGILSFGIAFLLTILFMVWYYRKSGLFASLALIFNMFALIGASAAFGIVLTLPGIAGIVLTIGMAVDANVLVFERIREELALGKTQKAAIKAGFSNAFSSIMDSNITTLLTGVVLFVFGAGPIKGFAVTLIIGILTSLVSALFLTRMILEYYADKGTPINFGSDATMKFFTGIDIKFTQRKRVFYVISGVLTLISLISFATVGFKTGVDFKGGRQYVVDFKGNALSDADLEKMRAGLTTTYKNESPVVKTLSSASQVQITTSYKSEVASAGQEVQELMMQSLATSFPSIKPQILSSSDVGPTVASDIRRAAILSIIFSLLIISLYIFIRFRNWQYSAGAATSLFHDVVIVLGIFSIFSLIPLPFNVEIDQAFIAAILTLIGYSINDTVVVFDRIRENLSEHPGQEISKVFDDAINQTLSRTLITSGTTLLSAFVLLVMGGTVIKGFVFAIFMGIIFGTYSSIFVASAIALDMFKKYPAKEETKVEVATAAK